MIFFENRNDMVRHYLQPGMVGAELGVFRGDFSEVILQTSPERLDLVDIFTGMMMSADHNGNNMVTVNLDDEFIRIQKKYESNKQVRVIRSDSVSYLSELHEGELDFVYIDADHSYNGVRLDLFASLRKIKPGGYIMGHDYTPQFPGVVRAVDEFCEKIRTPISSLSKCGCPSFCIQLPVTG